MKTQELTSISNSTQTKKSEKPEPVSLSGVFYSILAAVIWGVLPIFWKLCASVPAFIIMCHRIVWSCLLLMTILLIKRDWTVFKALKKRKLFLSLLVSGLLLGINWFVYINAVNTGHIVQASLGYYINPLFNVFIGVIFLKERMTFLQKVSFFLAAAGVLYFSIAQGVIPYVSLILMLTFGFYGLLKKTTALDSLSTIAAETMLLTPFALGYIILQGSLGAAVFGDRSPVVIMAILATGVVTSLPLFCFSEGAKRIPLSTLAFFQYLSPTFMLLIGVILYGEVFSTAHLVCFLCIWTALGLSTYSMLKQTGVKKGRGNQNT